MVPMDEVQRRAATARSILPQAGQLSWNYFQQGISHELKADRTPVTIADRETEALLRDTVRRHFPGDGFLGEEYGEEPGTTGFRWVIDPIDATKNFVRGIPLYANLVGLEWEGEVVAGFAYVPAFEHLYHAVKGQGAYRDQRQIHVSTVSQLSEALLIYTSLDWFDRTGTSEAFLELVRQSGRTRGFGDFYGYLLVAEGAAEVALEPQINPWDIAAVKPIVEEAGGVFTDWTGASTVYGQGCIAANPAIHAHVLDLVRVRPDKLPS